MAQFTTAKPSIHSENKFEEYNPEKINKGGYKIKMLDYFYENWLDKVITIVGVIVGVLSAVGIALSKIKEAIKAFKASSVLVVEKSEELQKANQAQTALNADVLKLYEEVQGLLKSCLEIADGQKQQREELQAELMKIQKALLIAFTNNSELVKKGQAATINNVIGVKNEEI